MWHFALALVLTDERNFGGSSSRISQPMTPNTLLAKIKKERGTTGKFSSSNRLRKHYLPPQLQITIVSKKMSPT